MALGLYLWKLRNTASDILLGTAGRRRIFTQIYSDNSWGSSESRSGTGSSKHSTEVLTRELLSLMKANQCRTILDAPCGDCNWISEILNEFDQYHGADIVPAITKANIASYASSKVAFSTCDIICEPLPQRDIILCRDFMIHVPTKHIWSALRNFKASRSTYLLLSSNAGVEHYADNTVGCYREINFRRAPFSFPEPLHTVQESAPHCQLCLWRLADLPL